MVTARNNTIVKTTFSQKLARNRTGSGSAVHIILHVSPFTKKNENEKEYTVTHGGRIDFYLSASERDKKSGPFRSGLMSLIHFLADLAIDKITFLVTIVWARLPTANLATVHG
ncbi:hypothetical protein GWI33_014117 [Rhynchophorus ferrugineus]|uniref:Uncharacterized protein n=1 Tax=Rhynchophorus ferrugineus TaxID=354439 RepID=A0A834I563_RHYFE|nr:hypothetical protein GWI33_014117 [Rhynchophorus ferrugineus]